MNSPAATCGETEISGSTSLRAGGIIERRPSLRFGEELIATEMAPVSSVQQER